MSVAAATAPVGRSAFQRFLGSYGQELVVLFSIIALFAVVGAANPRFLSDTNINSIFAGNAYIAVAAIGMSMVIISGHIDVSVGSLIGVIATIAGTLAVSGYPVWIAWFAPILFAVAVNAAVGALVAYTHIPSIVVTLGMLSILKGGLISATGGAWITDMPGEFMIAQMRLFGIPSPVYFMIVLTILAALFMRYTDFGRAVYAVGGNLEAARAAGIDPRAHRGLASSPCMDFLPASPASCSPRSCRSSSPPFLRTSSSPSLPPRSSAACPSSAARER